MTRRAGSANAWPTTTPSTSIPLEDISARLQAIGSAPARIDLIINSHFHFDHAGGNALIPNATMIVQRRDREVRLNEDCAAAHRLNPVDFDVGHTLRLVDGEHDVFGDGSVLCAPTPGQTLRKRRLPRYVHDRSAMLESLDRLQALEANGARIIFGHDTAFWRTVPQAPAMLG